MSDQNSTCDERVAISLPSGTWLVLLEYLAHSYEVWRGNGSEKSEDTFALLQPDAGERIALWHLEGAIEGTLPEVFASKLSRANFAEKERLISGPPSRQRPPS